MDTFAFGCVSVPSRSEKPRACGLTCVLDKGLGPSELADLLLVSGPFIDVAKFGWGTARLTPRAVLERKLSVYREAGVLSCTGGTFLEVATAQGRHHDFLTQARELGFGMIEVSNGVIDIPQERKGDLIREAKSRGFRVFSEVGRKDPDEDARISVPERLAAIQSELDAGADKIILESRESGTLGIFDSEGNPVEELLSRVLDRFGAERVIFEAPRKSQQVWLMRAVGWNVNLGNIAPHDALSVATLRSGLRGDTLPDVHLAGVEVFTGLGIDGALRARERGGVVIMVDALRASSTIVAALASGMRAVKPVRTAEECVGDVTAGERGGRKVHGLDHTNSPIEIYQGGYVGRTLVLTTTNGTECLFASKGERSQVLVGAAANCSAVAQEALLRAKRARCPVTIVMAGRNNQPAVEDEAVAAEIVAKMGNHAHVRGQPPRRAAALEADFLAGESGRNLIKQGCGEDVRYCARLDLHPVIPEFDGEQILAVPGALERAS